MNTAAVTVARRTILSLPLLLALVFVPALASPFSAPRTAVFTFLAFVLAGLAMTVAPLRALQDGEAYFLLAALAYVVIMAVCAAVSPLRYISLPTLAFAAGGLLLFGAARFALAENTQVFLVTVSAAALLVAMITIAQFCHLNPLAVLGLPTSLAGRLRMYSTLGNPNFVAAFLAAAIPAPFALALKERDRRVLWILSALVIAVAIVLTGSRAGVLALAAALSFGSIAVKNRVARWVVFAAIVLVCVVSATAHLNARTATETMRGRIFIWQVSLGNGAAGSALGSGPGSFSYLYPARMGQFFGNPDHAHLLRFAGHERHAQNDFVEAWHDTGWLGLVSLLTVFGLWLALARFRLRDSDPTTSPVFVAAMAGVIALFVASMFDFPLHRAETWALLWLWMAVPFAPQPSSSSQRLRLLSLRWCGAVLLALAGSYLALAQVAGSYWLGQGQRHEREGRVEVAREAYRSALKWDPTSPDANFNFVRAVAKSGDLSGALAQSQRAGRFVNEPELILLRSRIQQNAGHGHDAMRELQSGMRLFPYSQELKAELASCSSASATGE